MEVSKVTFFLFHRWWLPWLYMVERSYSSKATPYHSIPYFYLDNEAHQVISYKKKFTLNTFFLVVLFRTYIPFEFLI